MDSPPEYVIEAARTAAIKSPCAKSKRGVAAFNREKAGLWELYPQSRYEDGRVRSDEEIAAARDRYVIASTGFNGQPTPFMCSGSVMCRRDCAQLCLHAEDRAIRDAQSYHASTLELFELVHVKVVDGVVVPGKGPGCAQCSRLVVEVDLRGVWLYESITVCPSDTCPMCTNEECLLCGATAMRATMSSRQGHGVGVPVIVGGCEHDVIERHTGYRPPIGEWRFYQPERFHVLTLRNLRLGDRR